MSFSYQNLLCPLSTVMLSNKGAFNQKPIFILIFSVIVQVKCKDANSTSPDNGNSTSGNNGGGSGGASAKDEFKGPAAWLRICEGPGKYIGAVSAASKDSCSSGYWFKKSMKVGCACGHGV